MAIQKWVPLPIKQSMATLFCVLTFWMSSNSIAKAQDHLKTQKDYQRIISLAPHITEMLYSAGAGEKLVGVVQYSDFPPAARQLPIIGNANGLNLEAIVALKPDLILGWKQGNQAKNLKRLQAFGIHVKTTEIQSLNDIPKQIQYFGEQFGIPSLAQKTAKTLKQELNRIKKTYQNRSKVRTFYQLWNKPFITINNKQFIGQAIQLCGGQNIYHDLPLLSAEVSLESVISNNPQVILLGGSNPMQTVWKKDWQKWQSVSAVKNKQVHPLISDLFQRPTARMIMALEDLCLAINRARN